MPVLILTLNNIQAQYVELVHFCTRGAMTNRFVEKLKGFTDLSATEVAVLEQATAHPRKLAARHDLIREGDRPGPVFVMLDGWASRYKILPNGSRQITAFMMPGDCCDLHTGMLAEMDHSIQTVSRRASSPSRAGRWTS